MIYIIVGLGLFFLVIAFVVTEGNAQYLMSGLSDMSAAERKSFDIKDTVRFFRNFHLILSVTFLGIGLALLFFLDENAAGLFMVIYPILAYIYYLLALKRRSGLGKSVGLHLGVGVLVATLALVFFLTYRGIQPNNINLDTEKVSISGAYGIDIPYNSITAVELVEDLPPILRKRHGYAMGNVMKGEFRTESRERIRVIADKRFAPFVRISTAEGKDIFLTCREEPSANIVEQISGYMAP